LDSGQFWLSPKPWLPFGFSWLRLSAPRYLTWAHLSDRRSGFAFLFMNSHVDNNPINKEAAAGLIFEVFSKYARRMPVIFTGDFNTNPTTDRYQVFQQGAGDEIVFFNTADLAPERSMQPYISNGQDTGDLVPFEQFEHMIDHIFVAGPLQKEVFSWIVDYNTYGSPQRDASDHPALFSELRLTLDE
jgi:endonuclease/exonuclease/phosphatase family metal-dependent hydrolase